MFRPGSLIIGMITGMIAGVAFVLLLTPKSGDEFQRDIQDGIEDILENINSVIPVREFMVEKHLAMKKEAA